MCVCMNAVCIYIYLDKGVDLNVVQSLSSSMKYEFTQHEARKLANTDVECAFVSIHSQIQVPQFKAFLVHDIDETNASVTYKNNTDRFMIAIQWSGNLVPERQAILNINMRAAIGKVTYQYVTYLTIDTRRRRSSLVVESVTKSLLGCIRCLVTVDIYEGFVFIYLHFFLSILHVKQFMSHAGSFLNYL